MSPPVPEDLKVGKSSEVDSEGIPTIASQRRQPAGDFGNMVIMPDGTRHLFPLGTTQDQMQKALGLGIPKTTTRSTQGQPVSGDQIVDFARPFVGNTAGLLAAGGTGLLTKNPAIALGAETQGYALVDSLMQYLKTDKPKSYSEALTNSEMDAVVNAVAGRLVHSVWKGAKGVYNAGMPEIYKLAPTTSQVLENYGWNTLGNSAKFLEDFGAPKAKAAALDRVGGNGFTQSLALANSLNKRPASINMDPTRLADKIRGGLWMGVDKEAIPGSGTMEINYPHKEAFNLLEGGKTPFDKIDDVLTDTDKLAKVLKVGQIAGSPAMNVKQDLQAYQFMKIVNDATTKDAKGGIRIDSNKLAKVWNDPERQFNFDTLYGKATKERITNFFKTISYGQGPPMTSGEAKGLQYIGKGSFFMGLGLISKYLDLSTGTPGGIIGLRLGAGLIGRLLSKETTGKALMELVEGTRAGIPPSLKARVLVNGLQGLSIGLVNSQGKTTEGSFEEDPQSGMTKFVPYK